MTNVAYCNYNNNDIILTESDTMALNKCENSERGDTKFVNTLLVKVFDRYVLSKGSITAPEDQGGLNPEKLHFVKSNVQYILI